MKKSYFLATWFGLALCTPFFATDPSDRVPIDTPFCIRISDTAQLEMKNRGYTDLNGYDILVDPDKIHDTAGDFKKTILQYDSALIIFTETRNKGHLDVLAGKVQCWAELRPESLEKYLEEQKKSLIIENNDMVLTAQEYTTKSTQPNSLSTSGTTTDSEP